MLLRIKTIVKQKGQGIVEYGILLAIIVVIGMSLQSFGIKGNVSEIFDSVALLLSGQTEKDRWATMSADALLADSSSADARLKADQEFLYNIGKQFIGMNRSDVELVLGTKNVSNVLLGTFKESVDSNGNLTTDYYKRQKDGTPLTDNMYNWGQGNSSSASYDSSKRYLYSNAAVDFATTNKDYAGVKAMNIKYNTDGKVSSLEIVVNPRSDGQKKGLWVKVP